MSEEKGAASTKNLVPQVTFEAGGKELTMRLTLGAVRRSEELLGEGLMGYLGRFADAKDGVPPKDKPYIGKMAYIIAESTGEPIEWIDDNVPLAALGDISEALMEAMGIKKEDVEGAGNNAEGEGKPEAEKQIG